MGAVTIQAPPEQPLEIRLAPACYVHTRALDAEGKPIPGLEMSVSLTVGAAVTGGGEGLLTALGRVDHLIRGSAY